MKQTHSWVRFLLLCCLLALADPALGAPAPKLWVESGHPAYRQAMEDALQASVTEGAASELLLALMQGADGVEAFHLQAEPLLAAGAAERFDPHYCASAVIAVDRSRTSASIAGWRDLLTAHLPVGLAVEEPVLEYLWAAVSHGLTGRCDRQPAAGFFLDLHRQGRLWAGAKGLSAPVRIVLSHHVPNGWEVIVPQEGTLYFEKGLLWRTGAPAPSNSDMAPVLAQQGLSLVPPPGAARASAEALNAVGSVLPLVRRVFLRERRFSTASGYEHQWAALFILVALAFWLTSIYLRALPGPARAAISAVSLLEIGWSLVRVAKYMQPGQTLLGRYLWYAFYLFQLTIPLCFLLLASQLNRPQGGPRAPASKWLLALALVCAALIILVMTNDAHQWVFRFREGFVNWDHDYGYGLGYLLVYGYCLGLTVAAAAVLIAKAWRAPRKWGAVLSILVLAGLFAYGTGYVLRVPLMYESDMVLTFCIFITLFVEAAFQTGLIPINSGHRHLFTRADMGLQLLDHSGACVLRTRDAVALDASTRRLLATRQSPAPHMLDEGTWLYAAPVDGGTAVWQEDIQELARLNRALEQANATLLQRHEALQEEQRIQGELASLRAQNRLYADVEAAASAKLIQIQQRLNGLSRLHGAQARWQTARINLLACAVKRSCGLLMRGLQQADVPADSLAIAISEIAEFSGFAGMKCTTLLELRRSLPAPAAQALYDFFFRGCERALDCGCVALFVRLYEEAGSARLMMLTDAPCMDAHTVEAMGASLRQLGGRVTLKNLDGAYSLVAGCPLGGEASA